MPKKYEGMRDSFVSQGMSESAAKSKAAAIYNAQRKPRQRPVTQNRAGHRTKDSRRSLADARRPRY
jgi:hypothetical protein